MGTRVMVSGCFDMLRGGHIGFLEAASKLGDELYVSVGSDTTIEGLKGRRPIVPEAERLEVVLAIWCVDNAAIGPAAGVLDFEPLLSTYCPNVFAVGPDGDTQEKRELCERYGVTYCVLHRPPKVTEAAHTTDTRAACQMPYRLDLAGGWLDQPEVSKLAPGPVICCSIEPDHKLMDRSGMATSTRDTAIRLWGDSLPKGQPLTNARTLFDVENLPDREYLTGSQDAIGLAVPGLHRLDYDGGLWPQDVFTFIDEDTFAWLESILWLIPHVSRPNWVVIQVPNERVTKERVKRLAAVSNVAWKAIENRDHGILSDAMRYSYEAQIAMFPSMATNGVAEAIKANPTAVKVAGAGGGGYLIAVSEDKPENGIPIRIRRT